jgi:hypothetical protein
MKRASRIMLWLGLAGLLVPQFPTVSAAEVPPVAAGARNASPVAILDVALTKDNVLRGQLVNGQGAPKAGAQVLVGDLGNVVAKGVTGEQGFFAIRLNNGGVYTISDGETTALVRVWTALAAPPVAKQGILMVSDRNVTRGEVGGPPAEDEAEGGYYYHGVNWNRVVGWGAVIGVTTAVIIAATAS